MDNSSWLVRNAEKLRFISALVLILSLVFLGIYLVWLLVAIPEGLPPRLDELELRDLLAFLPMLVSCFTAFLSLATFAVSTAATLAKHRREQALSDLDIQQRRLEIEKTRRELEEMNTVSEEPPAQADE